MSNWEWRKTIGALLTGLGMLLGGCAAGVSEGRPVLGLDGRQFDVSDPVERGRALVLTGQYGLAIDGLTQVATRNPGDARALTLLAVAYGQLKRFDLADRYHARALEIDPDSVAALNNWGYSYLVRGDKDRAADLLQRAVAAGGGRPIVAANLALARGDDPAADADDGHVTIANDPMRSVRLSQHVTLVRPTRQLMRVAPGVQMLLTRGPVAAPAVTQVSQAPRALAPLVPVIGGSASAGIAGSRFALFRALFALMDGDALPPIEGVRIQNQLASLAPAAQASPFGFFPDVDDFTRP